MPLRLYSFILFVLVLTLAGCGGGEASDTAESVDGDRDAVGANLEAFADEIAQALLSNDDATLRARYVPRDRIDGCQMGIEQFDSMRPMADRYDDEKRRFESLLDNLDAGIHERVLDVDPNMWGADGTTAVTALEGETCTVDFHGEAWITLVRQDRPPHLDEYRMYLIYLDDQWYHYDDPGHTDFDCDESTSEECQMYNGAS